MRRLSNSSYLLGARNTVSVDVRVGPAFCQAMIFVRWQSQCPSSPSLSGDPRSWQPALDGKLGKLPAVFRYSRLHVWRCRYGKIDVGFEQRVLVLSREASHCPRWANNSIYGKWAYGLLVEGNVRTHSQGTKCPVHLTKLWRLSENSLFSPNGRRGQSWQ